MSMFLVMPGFSEVVGRIVPAPFTPKVIAQFVYRISIPCSLNVITITSEGVLKYDGKTLLPFGKLSGKHIECIDYLLTKSSVLIGANISNGEEGETKVVLLDLKAMKSIDVLKGLSPIEEVIFFDDRILIITITNIYCVDCINVGILWDKRYQNGYIYEIAGITQKEGLLRIDLRMGVDEIATITIEIENGNIK